MAHFGSIDELLASDARPEHISDWYLIDQPRIAAFAEATDDRQWIHLDTTRAAEGPYGTTIAHGYLTLSLLPHLTADALTVAGTGMRLNYGLDRVRFTNPVPAGSRVRARTAVAAVEPTKLGVRVTLDITVEIEGHERPALVASQILVVIPEAA
ncbi:MaoC family dehydratase [soil metagenome]